jgi:hypothetical protein
MAPARVATAGAEARSPLLRGRRSPVPEMRASFCAKATGAGGSEAASSTEEGAEPAGGEAGEGEKASSAIAAPPRPAPRTATRCAPSYYHAELSVFCDIHSFGLFEKFIASHLRCSDCFPWKLETMKLY